MTPIDPGTICVIVQTPDGRVPDFMLGRVVPVLERLSSRCDDCGAQMYEIRLDGVNDYTCRSALRPILPPGVDIAEQSVDLMPEPAV